MEKPKVASTKSTIECYDCDSPDDVACSHDVVSSTKTKTCPAEKGCYLLRRLDGKYC